MRMENEMGRPLEAAVIHLKGARREHDAKTVGGEASAILSAAMRLLYCFFVVENPFFAKFFLLLSFVVLLCTLYQKTKTKNNLLR